MKFPTFWNRTPKDENLKEQVLLNQQQADMNQPIDPYEAVRQAEREKNMLGDQFVNTLLANHPEYKAFIPALASVNRTTKHVSKTDMRIAWLDFQILQVMTEMCMNPDKFEEGAMEMMQGFEMYHNNIISDGHEGWKGNILTQQRKIISANVVRGK